MTITARCGSFLLGLGVCVAAVSECSAIAQSAHAQSAPAKTPFARGCEQMMHKNFNSAISSFTEAIADDSGDVNSYFRRGQSFFCIGNYKEAIVDFDRALANGSMDYNVYLWKGTANAKLDNVDQAIFNYEKAMRLNPKLVDSFRNQELLSKDSSKPTTRDGSKEAPGSESGAKNALKEAPGSENGAKNALKEAPGSESAAKNALKDASKEASKTTAEADFGAMASRAAALQNAVTSMIAAQHTPAAEDRSAAPKSKSETLSLGRSEGAVDAYKTAARRIIENETGYFRPGTTYSGLLNLSDGLVPLSGFQGQPDWIESAREGRPYFSLKDPKRDLKELDAQIISHPQDATLFFQRARVSQQLGKDKETLSDLNRAIELDASNANYVLARAFYYHQQKNADAAEAEIRRAQDVDPAVPSILTFDPPTKKAQQ